MIHHDEREYQAAVGETAERFQRQLDEAIRRTSGSALSVIEKIQREIPTDRYAHSQSLAFAVDKSGGQPRLLMGVRNRRAKGHFQEPLHKHALHQVVERAGIPALYVTRLLERPYGLELLRENLATIYGQEEDKQVLVRSVGQEIRGVLSNAYRRMDSGPIVEAFARACQGVGAKPIEGVGGDLRWAIKCVLPKVFQPATRAGNEELIAFGIELSNSDYGCGTLSVKVFVQRIICTNYATMEQAMREVHLGKRVGADDFAFSEKTIRLDTEAQVSKVQDIVKGILAPKRVNELVGRIGKALDERIDPRQAWSELPKLGLLKGEVEKVKELFNDAGVEVLPAGTSPARLSNAISWFAKSAEPERRLELEAVAGKILVEPIALKEAA